MLLLLLHHCYYGYDHYYRECCSVVIQHTIIYNMYNIYIYGRKKKAEREKNRLNSSCRRVRDARRNRAELRSGQCRRRLRRRRRRGVGGVAAVSAHKGRAWIRRGVRAAAVAVVSCRDVVAAARFSNFRSILKTPPSAPHDHGHRRPTEHAAAERSLLAPRVRRDDRFRSRTPRGGVYRDATRSRRHQSTTTTTTTTVRFLFSSLLLIIVIIF